MDRFAKIVFAIILVLLQTGWGNAQSCDSITPTYNVALSGFPDGSWISPTIARDGLCCSALSPDRCIEFFVTLDTASIGIILDIASGTLPTGSLIYEYNCGVQTAMADTLFLTGAGPHRILFCKPGTNTNTYSVTAISPPPVAGFYADQNIACINAPVLFTDSSSGIISGYSWDFGPGASLAPGTSGAGPHSVTWSTSGPKDVSLIVTGNSSDTIQKLKFITVNNNPVSSITPQPAIICSGSDLFLNSNLIGGTAPYTMVWSGSTVPLTITNDSLTTFNSAASGNYDLTFTATDANGCTSQDTVIVVNKDLPSAIDQTPSVCEDSTGSAKASGIDLTLLEPSITGGQGSIVSWYYDPTLSNPVSSPNNVTIEAGQVVYAMVSFNGCNAVATVTYNIVSGFTANNLTPFVCEDTVGTLIANNVDLTALEGSIAQVGITWYEDAALTTPVSNPANTSVMDGNIYYAFAVSGTCKDTSFVNFSVNSKPVVNAGTDQSMCSSSEFVNLSGTITNGSLGVWSTLGDGSFNLDTSVLNNSYAAGINDNANGAVYLLLSSISINSCATIVDTIFVEIFSSIETNLFCTVVSCFGGNDGSCASTVTNGTPPYSYNWSNGETMADAGNLSAGNYVLVVSDQSGCADTVSSVISEPTLLEAGASVNAANCGLSNGNALAVPSGGTPPYNYSWSNGGVDSSTSTLNAGNYTLNIIDANGCMATHNFIVNNLDGPTINSITSMPASCPSACDGSASADVSGGTSPYTYQWNTNATGPGANGLCPGNYSLSVTDQTGCAFAGQVIITSSGIDPAIAGNVSISGGPITKGIVEVIAQADNSAVLEIVATGNIDSLGNYFIQDIPVGDYRIAAKADSLLYPNSAKTYLNMHYRWDLTTAVSSNCNAVDSFDLELITKPNMNGNGSISGTVSSGGSGKTKGPGDPIPGIDITLDQNPGGIISNTVTDADGNYKFENVPVGNNYGIFVDIPGLEMLATYNLNITGNDTIIKNDFFVDSTGTIDTFLNITGIKHKVVHNDGVEIFIAPNPFKNTTFITMNLGKTSEIYLDIYDIRGVIVESVKSGKTERGTYTFRFDDTKAPNGIYFVKIKTTGEIKVMKMVKSK